MEQTVRFDSSVCLTPAVQQAYRQACRGTETCVQGLQSFCTTDIHTNAEFNTHSQLLECHIQCQSDRDCQAQCASSAVPKKI